MMHKPTIPTVSTQSSTLPAHVRATHRRDLSGRQGDILVQIRQSQPISLPYIRRDRRPGRRPNDVVVGEETPWDIASLIRAQRPG